MKGLDYFYVDHLKDRLAYCNFAFQTMKKYLPSQFSQEDWIAELDRRENLGNFQIGRHTLLPHIEVEGIERSRINLLLLQKPLMWSEDIQDVYLIVTFLVKKDGRDLGRRDLLRMINWLAEEEIESDVLALRNVEELEAYLSQVFDEG
ncbi:PTS sugar transporter subunit IIA [Atopobacter sp. AH10]|uniref:PTS sugar transporter subunit IIA n=1 Tax=Atopobacter sp. AH10 TaxID=2315861 RepID=UPI000EF25959|nr:PTS sugar transporter subunit IIA [Atopobacter sp. AH10]RLK63317.1 PTS sugar transporter subunit IIA [Atopobacter sp. AH10]